MLSVLISILSISFRNLVDLRALHCLSILFGDFILDVEGSLSSLAEGRLNAILGLSLFTLGLICFCFYLHIGQWKLLAFVYWRCLPVHLLNH